MKVKIFWMTMGLIVVVVNGLYAQNLFWSELGLGQGSVEGDLTINAEVGDTGTAFLYYNPIEQDVLEGFDFDFSWDSSGLAGFTAAESFDFEITVQGIPFGIRWGDFSGPAVATSDTVTDFLAVNV